MIKQIATYSASFMDVDFSFQRARMLKIKVSPKTSGPIYMELTEDQTLELIKFIREQGDIPIY